MTNTKLNQLFFAVCCGAMLLGCPSPTPGQDAGVDSGIVSTRIDVSADITTATTWTKNNTYILKTLVYVDGATLTIEAGTQILGDSGSALIVTKTGKLVAEGTATAPIIFSVNAPVEGRE